MAFGVNLEIGLGEGAPPPGFGALGTLGALISAVENTVSDLARFYT